MDPGIWVPLACTSIGAVSGLFGLLVRHHLETVKADREAYRELQNKVMDKAVPALEHNASVGEAMIEATRALKEQLAVMADRDGRGRR